MDQESLTHVLRALGISAIRKSGPRHLAVPCLFSAWTHEHGRDRVPSMTVSISQTGESWVKCHACEYKRSFRLAVKELSSKTAGGRFADISAWVDANEGRDLDADADWCENWREDVHDYTKEVKDLLGIPFPGEAVDFLREKGVTDKNIILKNLLWSDKLKAIVIPTLSCKKGRLVVIGSAARRPPKWVEAEGDKRKYWTIWEYEPYFHLYGEHRLVKWKHKTILLVEGQLDALHCWECGVPAVALMGIHFSKPKGQLLQQAQILRAVLCLDPEVYSTERRKKMVIDSTIQTLRGLGIEARDEKLKDDPKHLDAETLRAIIKKPRIKDSSL